jgi:hypothetical protein
MQNPYDVFFYDRHSLLQDAKCHLLTFSAPLIILCHLAMEEKDCDVLLTLFRLQKQRVFQRIREGGKAPKAVVVCGEGLGSWGPLTLTSSQKLPIPQIG